MSINSAQIDALFQLLDRLTREKPNEDHKPLPHPFLRKWERLVLIFCVYWMISFVLLVGLEYSGVKAQWFSRFVLGTGLLLVGLMVTYLPTVAGWTIWSNRKQPFAIMMASVRNSLHRDVSVLDELREFSRENLSYGLTKYRYCWAAYDRRTRSLCGDMQALGLIPALAATLISVVELTRTDESHFLWGAAILLVAFNLMGFVLQASYERPKQIIDLLEFVLQEKDRESSAG